MNKLISLAAVAVFSTGFAGAALALNPQPEPPGRTQVVHAPAAVTLHSIGSQSSAGGAAADADDTYCGTKVPGHPHLVLQGAAARCNAHALGGSVMLNPQPLPPGARMNTIGSATSGAGSGR